jgi:hypothetical protein
MQDVIPLRIHHGNQVVCGEAWRLFKEAYPECNFFDFWHEACQDFSMRSFQLSWFFLQRDSYALATEASNPRTFVKTEPLSPKTSDYDFAYASDTAEHIGRNPGHVVEVFY